MNSNLKEVKLLGIGIHLPGDPIPFEKIEETIGALNAVDPIMKTRIEKLRNIMKKILKACCYLAVDPKTKKPLETEASLSVKAIKSALKKASLKPQDIELIVL